MEAYFTRMIGIFGSVDELARDYIGKKTVEKILAMPNDAGKDAAILGSYVILSELKKRVGDSSLKTLIDIELGKLRGLPASAAGGGKMSRKYCKKTPCRKMGFSQKASCRPWKNCYTTRRRGSKRFNT